MPSFSSVINSLLRLFPSEKGAQLFKSAQKLHPQSEPLANAHLTRALIDENTGTWYTRHAFEASRGWHWPYWINAQLNVTSSAYTSPAYHNALANTAARDAAPVVGIPNLFCGMIDRRGMVTPPHGRFSLETWFRFPDGLMRPAAVLDDSQVEINPSIDTTELTFATAYGPVKIRVQASGKEELKHIKVSASCEPVSTDGACPASIYFAIRPYTPDGVVPVHDLVYNSKGFWMSDSQVIVWFPQRPDVSWASDAQHDDAAFFLADPPERTAVRCPAGLATAISGWHLPLRENSSHTIEAILPLHPIPAKTFPFAELLHSDPRRSVSVHTDSRSDVSALRPAISLTTGSALDPVLELANQHLTSLTDISEPAIHSAFLFRSSWLAAGVRALVYQGNYDQAQRLLQLPLIDIQKNGNLSLAAGKWSLHGQVLTAAADYHQLTQAPAERPVVSYSTLRTIARWIMRKRREVAHAPDKPQGLFPPGVTRSNTGAEYQLADNMWELQGIASAAWLARHFQEHRDADVLHKETRKYAANIAAAMHRELEYSLSQQVPGRLHRAFDPATASEVLEIVLMKDSWRLLKADTWLPRLIDTLFEPLPHQLSTDAGYTLRRIDESGVYPARRLQLCLAMHKLNDRRFNIALEETLAMQTPLRTWPECLNPHTGLGVGRDMVDPDATALLIVLARQLLLDDDDGIIIKMPSLPIYEDSGTVTFSDAPTAFGSISCTLSQNQHEQKLTITQLPPDPTLEVHWKLGNVTTLIGVGTEALGTHIHNLNAFTNNHDR